MDFKSDLAKQWAEAFPKYLILEGNANYDGFHDNLKVHLAIRRDGQLESAGTILKPDIEELLSVAVVSKFGNGSETVLDESVRKGTELGPDILELSPCTMVNSSEPTTAFVEQRLAEIVQKEIRSDLFPYAQSISLQFTKLAMYEQGGHFLEHRDTPHAPNHQGTLLVMLHSEHDGGDLIFNIDGDSQETWNVRTKGWTTDAVRWCAFHTDIPHKVEPVKSGVRAVLQFDIFVSHHSEHWDNDDDYDGESRLEKASTNKEVSRVNDTAVDTFVQRLMPQLKTQSIALPLFHAYQYSYVRPEFLKSADRMLFDALLKAGHSVMLTPIILSSSKYFCDNDGYKYEAGPADSYDKIYYQSKAGKVRAKKAIFESSPGVKYIWTKTTVQCAEYFTQAYIERTGNYAMPEEMRYFSAAIVILSEEDLARSAAAAAAAKKRNEKESK